MSLKQTITGIVACMESEMADLGDESAHTILRVFRGYINSLKAATAAADDVSVPAPFLLKKEEPAPRSHLEDLYLERAAHDSDPDRMDDGACMVFVEGSEVSTMVPIDAKMPVGAFTQVDGAVYQLQVGDGGARVLRPVPKTPEEVSGS